MLDAYKRWVRGNAGMVNAVESGLSLATWVLPDNGDPDSFKAEAVRSAVGLVSIFHENILSQGTHEQGGTAASTLSFYLAALQQLEVLVEVGGIALEGQRRGTKYDALAALEALKCVLRVALLHSGGGRLLLAGGVANPPTSGSADQHRKVRAKRVELAFERFRRKHNLSPGTPLPPPARKGCAGGSACAASKPGKSVRWADSGPTQRSARAGGAEGPAGPPSSLPSAGQAAAPAAAAMGGGTWQDQLGAHVLVAGELLHVLRPLVYVLALRSWGARSWRPWLLSLAVELSSLQLTQAGGRLDMGARVAAAAAALPPGQRQKQHVTPELLASLRSGGGAAGGGGAAAVAAAAATAAWATPAERQELLRRKMLLAYYLLRSPFFELHTRRAVQGLQGVTSYVPLLRGLVDKAVDILEHGVVPWYTYTAAS